MPNMRLRDAGVPGVRDDRALEAVAFGLPLRSVPVFADITVVSPVQADGAPAHRADTRDGAAANEAENRKRRRYHELVTSPDARLQVIALETGGRWSKDASNFFYDLAWAKAASAPLLLRAAAAHAWFARWTAILSVASQGAFAASLLGREPGSFAGCDGTAPPLSELLVGPAAPSLSRLPAPVR